MSPNELKIALSFDGETGWGGLGNHRIGAEAAVAGFEKDPCNHLEWYLLGNQFYHKSRYTEAAYCYDQAIRIHPGFKEACNNLGIVLLRTGYYQKALKILQNAINQNPSYIDPYINIGIVFEKLGQPGRAKKCYQKALEIDPFLYEANVNLGKLYELEFKLNQALACYFKAMGQTANECTLHFNIGTTYHKRMEIEKSLDHFKNALIHDPQCLAAKCHYLLNLPIIYRTANEIDYYRQRYTHGLNQMVSQTPLESAHDIKQSLNILENFTPFYLQYQAKNDLGLQKQYGAFVHRIMTAAYPQWSQTGPMPPETPGRRLRIGYVSSYMQSHSVGKFIIGWLRNHDHDRFKIHCYYINQKFDALTAEFKANTDSFHHMPEDIRTIARRILADKLHVLVFTDIGMFPKATMLAGLRLAPVQCVTWGHPITTGLPTIDYFLSSDLMEPPHAQDHYSEKLIRLPNLALAQHQDDLPIDPKQRAEFGLSEDRFIYLSSQSLYKYLPEYDFVYPAIALSVSKAQFVFIASPSPFVTEKFKARLTRAFLEYGLEFGDCCTVLPRMKKPDFLSLNRCVDVLLDTFEWSGCNSSMEGIGSGLAAVVTCPGRFMRGRHTYAMLRMMGIEETIAKDVDDFIAIAIRLGTDRKFFRHIRSRMNNSRNILFDDIGCVRALENFYCQAIKAYKFLG